MTAALWVTQGIMAFPNKLNFDGSKVFKSFGVKTFLTLSSINLFAILLVQSTSGSAGLSGTEAMIVGYYHEILALLPLVAVYAMLSNKIPVGTND
jgi:hypothetical protein